MICYVIEAGKVAMFQAMERYRWVTVGAYSRDISEFRMAADSVSWLTGSNLEEKARTANEIELWLLLQDRRTEKFGNNLDYT